MFTIKKLLQLQRTLPHSYNIMADTSYKLATQGLIRVVAQNCDIIDHCLTVVTIESAKYQVMIVYISKSITLTTLLSCVLVLLFSAATHLITPCRLSGSN